MCMHLINGIHDKITGSVKLWQIFISAPPHFFQNARSGMWWMKLFHIDMAIMKFQY